jgi:hypothetical protein
MSSRPHSTEPCWEIVRIDTGLPPEADGGDGWPHFTTRAEAAEEIARRVAEDARWQNGQYGDGDRLQLRAAQSFDGPCVGLFCDGTDCDGEPIDVGGDEGWTHLDPSDPIPMDLDDLEVIEWDGKHYCEGCWSTWPWCDDCDERHPAGECHEVERPPSRLCTTPDGTVLDVPLFEAT